MIRNEIIVGDVLDPATWAKIPDASVHCVVTSPPYWGLRDYGVAGQLGLEATPAEYLEKMVAVFRFVWNKLRDDGTLLLNMGDTYVGGKPKLYNGNETYSDLHWSNEQARPSFRRDKRPRQDDPHKWVNGLKPKDLCGMPWRLAFALQADGWYLRGDNIWHKPNPMPGSQTDRCTTAHEYVFHLAKTRRYFFDEVAISEPVTGTAHARGNGVNPKAVIGSGVGWSYGESDPRGRKKPRHKQNADYSGAVNELVSRRKKRTVWTITTQAYPDAHFATFPEALVEPCILAGTSEKGCCPQCGAPWRRVVEREPNPSKQFNVGEDLSGGAAKTGNPQTSKGLHRNNGNAQGPPSLTIGWRPSCDCYSEQWVLCVREELENLPRTNNARKRHQQNAAHRWRDRATQYADRAVVPRRHSEFESQRAVVADIFIGSGTTGVVAEKHGRDWLGIELNGEYAVMALDRIARGTVAGYVSQDMPDHAPLFAATEEAEESEDGGDAVKTKKKAVTSASSATSVAGEE